ncbi:MAG: hypothetical protein OXU61_08025 [Gammaproteobacteria bacterium]|nr:hypothetical protein [Gammaproteobacteria bacterium]MDD9824360.1 hypothetical protein [Gammaproteobacteria bacterium]MDD9863122.1 hypothetical protein [Gammaproteobacteria bacterium]
MRSLDPETLRLHNRRAARWASAIVESLLSRSSERGMPRLLAAGVMEGLMERPVLPEGGTAAPRL